MWDEKHKQIRAERVKYFLLLHVPLSNDWSRTIPFILKKLTEQQQNKKNELKQFHKKWRSCG